MESLFLIIVEYLNGKTAVLDGVSGVITLDVSKHGEIRLIHTPDKNGRKTAEYHKWVEYLRGDYVSDITEREDLGDIAENLGFVF